MNESEVRTLLDLLPGALVVLLWVAAIIYGIVWGVFPLVVMSRLKKIEALLERISNSLDRAEDRGTGDNPFKR